MNEFKDKNFIITGAAGAIAEPLINKLFEETKMIGWWIFFIDLSNISMNILWGSPPTITIGLKFIYNSSIIYSFIVERGVHS